MVFGHDLIGDIVSWAIYNKEYTSMECLIMFVSFKMLGNYDTYVY